MSKIGKGIDLAAVATLTYHALPNAIKKGQELISKYEGITSKTQVGRVAETFADFGIEYGPAIGTGMLAAYIAGRLLRR